MPHLARQNIAVQLAEAASLRRDLSDAQRWVRAAAAAAATAAGTQPPDSVEGVPGYKLQSLALPQPRLPLGRFLGPF